MFHCNPWSRRYAYATNCGHTAQHTSKPFLESRSGRSGGFGVRRPIRYLSYHLDLDDDQRRKVAISIDRIKLEREQMRIDRKKADAKLAEVLANAEVSVDQVKSVLSNRESIVEDSQVILANELVDIVSILDSEQREEFAQLIRNGTIKL